MVIDDTKSFNVQVISTKIRNSNGNNWDAIPENIPVAINDLSGPGTVWLPPNTVFDFNFILNLENDLTFLGAGNTTVLKRANNSLQDIMRIGEWESTGRHNIRIENMLFDGNCHNNNAKYEVESIDLRGDTSNVLIKNCFFKDSVGTNIGAHIYTSNITVDSCNFNYVKPKLDEWPSAIWFGGSNNIARNNFIKDVWAAGIVFESITAERPSMNNLAENNEVTGVIAYGLYMEGKGKSKNCTFRNNHVHDIDSEAYSETNNMAGEGIIMTEGSICEDNIFENILNPNFSGIHAVGDVTIQRNTIRNIGYFGIWHHFDNTFLTGNATIKDNILENIHGESAIRGETNCVETLSNNTITNAAKYGIRSCNIMTNNHIYGAITGISRGITINDNDVENCTIGITPSVGADVLNNNVKHCSYRGIQATLDNMNINDNTVEDGGETGIQLDSASQCSVLRNTVFGSRLYEIAESGSADYNDVSYNILNLGTCTPLLIIGPHTTHVGNVV